MGQKRNIYVRMRGGLGNQMFQYAFAYLLSKKIDGSVCLASLYEVFRRYKNELIQINEKNK